HALATEDAVDDRHGLDVPLAEEQEVEVERPLTPADRADPSRAPLDVLQNVEQVERAESRLDCGCRVEEGPLSPRAADRRRFAIRADSADDAIGPLPQRGDGRIELRLAVAEVAPQSDQRQGAH